MRNKNYNNLGTEDWLDNLLTWKQILVIFVFFGIVLIGLISWFVNKPNYKIVQAMDRHENTILVETLAEIPKGPYIHRVVDKDMNKVCYVNCAGGGIVCFDLDDISISTEKKEDLLSQHNKMRRAYNNGYYNYSSTNTHRYKVTQDE